MRLSPQKSLLKIHYGIFATVALSSTALFAGLLLSTSASPAHAEETEIKVNVPISIAISASPTTVDIGNLAPEAFGTDYTDLTVSTNSAGGYSLNIASSSSTSASLIHSSGASTGHIDSITAPVTINTTGSNFPGDKWGYSVGLSSSSTSKDYKVVPLSGSATEIASKDTPAMDDVTRVNFGTRPTSSSASGTYSGSVVFSAIAKEVDKDITDLTSMQDLANHPTYCTNSLTGTTATLVDERDPSGKQYKVKKLADGNCWMVDNMKIADLTIEPTKSNVPTGTSFVLPATFAGSTSVAGPTWGNQEKTAKVIDATGAVASNGYLYNWYAATAGAQADASDTISSLMTADSGSAAGDICPKGWRLPDKEGSKSFYNLYNIEYPTASGQHPYQSTANMQKSDGIYPGFVFTGYYAFNSGLVGSTGYGYYWSRTVYNAFSSYSLSLNSSGVYPQGNHYKGNGFAVRCVSAY